MTQSSDTAKQAVKRFREIEDQAKRLNAVSNHLANRVQEARERRQRAEIELQEEERALKRIPSRLLGRPEFRRPEPHPELLREVEEARLEHERLNRDYEEARVRWQQVGQLRERCRQVLLDRGITIEQTYMARHTNVPAYRSNPDLMSGPQRII